MVIFEKITRALIHSSPFQSIGFAQQISKSNLAYANEKRNWQIFADFASLLITKWRNCIVPDEDLGFGSHEIYAIDTTTIELCLDVFWRAKFRKHKAAVRLGSAIHELNVLDIIDFEPVGIYAMDDARLRKNEHSIALKIIFISFNYEFFRTKKGKFVCK